MQVNETIKEVIEFMLIENITRDFYFRRKGFFFFGKNSSGTKDSTYAEKENQRMDMLRTRSYQTVSVYTELCES